MRVTIWEDIPTFPDYQATRDHRIRHNKNELKPFHKDGKPHVKLWKILDADKPWRQFFIVAVDLLVQWTFGGQCRVCHDNSCVVCEHQRRKYVWRTLPGKLLCQPIPSRRSNKRGRVQPYG
jgi:hypothetical protein